MADLVKECNLNNAEIERATQTLIACVAKDLGKALAYNRYARAEGPTKVAHPDNGTAICSGGIDRCSG